MKSESTHRAVTPVSTAEVEHAIALATMLVRYWDQQKQQKTPARKAVAPRPDYYCTLQEVATVLGCTRENARLIQIAALDKLRHRYSLRFMKEYLR